jgi:Inosine-uridine nucleoside N-ribohydrolase
MRIRMIGWHLSRGTSVLNEIDLSSMANKGSLLSNFVLDSNRIAQKAYLQQTGEVGLSLPDAVAMACSIDPTICLSSSDHYVDIETESMLTLGMTVVDRLDISSDIRNREIWNNTLQNQKNKINIPWKIDSDKYKCMLLDCF